MGSLLDYLSWRGDLTFSQDPFNEVDGLVLAILAYMDFTPVFTQISDPVERTLSRGSSFLKSIGEQMKQDDLPFLKDVPEFLERAARTNRFGSIALKEYIHQLDPEKTKQFSATIFSAEPSIHVVSFRGTDDSVAGWKEDLEMSFKSHVPAQIEGRRFLTEQIPSLDGEVYLVGHSKGGNIAIYAAATLPVERKKPIKTIYNYDGPGFHEEFVESSHYRSIVDRVETILPESSVVGVLMEQKTRYRAVNCATGLALMQHNPFLWNVLGNTFEAAGSLSKKSKGIQSTVQTWLRQLTPDEQKTFIDALFSVLDEAGIRRFSDVTKDAFSSAQGILKAYGKLDDEKKEHMKKVLDMLWDEGGKTLTLQLATDLGVFIEKNRRKLIRRNEKKETKENVE